MSALDLVQRFEDAGVAAIIYTDITATACLTGLNLDAAAELARATSIPVIASGGLASIEDVKRLLRPGYAMLGGAIAGRALYDGRLDAAEALALIAAASERDAAFSLGQPRWALRTIFVLLLVLIALVGLAPALIGVGSQMIAEAAGCQVDLNRVIPCVIDGRDYGPLFYKLGFAIWYSYVHPRGPRAARRVGGRRRHRGDLRHRQDALVKG